MENAKIHNEIISNLTNDIPLMKDHGEDIDAKSWQYEEGILLSIREAEYVLSILKTTNQTEVKL